MKTAPHAGFLQCRLAFGLLWLHLGQVFSLAAPAVCIGGMPRARAPRYKTGAEDTVFCRQLGAATGSAAAPYKNPGSLNRLGPSSYPPACSCTSEPGNSNAFAVLFPPPFLCVCLPRAAFGLPQSYQKAFGYCVREYGVWYTARSYLDAFAKPETLRSTRQLCLGRRGWLR